MRFTFYIETDSGAQLVGIDSNTVPHLVHNGDYILKFGEFRLRVSACEKVPPYVAQPAEPSVLQTQAHIADTIAELTANPL